MAASLGTLTLDLVARIASFTDPLRQAEQQSRTSTTAIERHAQNTTASLKSMAAASLGFLSVGALFGAYVQNTQDAENEQAQLAATLKSTGFAAKFSQDQLNDMSGAMSAMSTVSGGEITQAQTTLLAFTGIVGNEFPRALQAAIDMAARTGTSVVSAAETIGRALDVPSQGLSALSKQGFRFTEDQKVLAKQLEDTGHTAEAQAIILNELENSYGGAAAAARDTFTGSLIAAKNAANDLLTGDGSLELAKDVLNGITEAMSRPEARQALEALTVAAVGYAVVMGGRVVASNVAASISFIAAQREAARYTAALAAMAGMSARAAATQTLLGAATRGAGAVLGVFGGPLGLAATIGISAAAYLLLHDNSSVADRALESSAKYADITTKSFLNLKSAQQDVIKSDLKESFNTQGVELDRLANNYASLTDELIFYAKQQGLGSKYAGDFIEIQKGVRNGTIAYADALDRLNSMEFLTTAQKKQALDAISAYDKQYSAVMQTGNSLDAVGLKYTVAGSAAQNAANGITANGNAAGTAAGQYDVLSKAMQDYIDKTKQGIFANSMQLNLRQKGFSPEQSKGLTDARIAKGSDLTGGEANLVLAGVKSNEALAKSNAAIAASAKSAAKGESELEKARKKASDAAVQATEQRLSSYKQILESFDDESTKVNKAYSEQKRLIEEFAPSADVAKQVQQAHDAAKQKLTEISVAQARAYNQFFEFETDRAEVIEAHYEQEKHLAASNTAFTLSEREQIFDALQRQKQQELDTIRLNDAQSLLYAKQGYMPQKDYMSERYAQEREEIRLTQGKSEEWHKSQMDALEDRKKREEQAAQDAALQSFGSAFQSTPLDNMTNQFDEELAVQGELLNQGYIQYEQYLQSKAALTEKYTKQERDMQLNLYSSMLGQAGQTWGSLTALVKQSAGESSGAYKTMFAVQQAFAIGSALVSAHLASAQVMADPTALTLPQKVMYSNIILGMGYANAGMIAGQTIAGMAHSGIDNIPKEGTWLLDGGERVLNPKQNSDLTGYLQQRKANNTGVVINVNNSTNADVSARQEADGSITVDVVEKMIKRSWGNMSNPNSFESKQVQRNTTAARAR